MKCRNIKLKNGSNSIAYDSLKHAYGIDSALQTYHRMNTNSVTSKLGSDITTDDNNEPIIAFSSVTNTNDLLLTSVATSVNDVPFALNGSIIKASTNEDFDHAAIYKKRGRYGIATKNGKVYLASADAAIDINKVSNENVIRLVRGSINYSAESMNTQMNGGIKKSKSINVAIENLDANSPVKENMDTSVALVDNILYIDTSAYNDALFSKHSNLLGDVLKLVDAEMYDTINKAIRTNESAIKTTALAHYVTNPNKVIPELVSNAIGLMVQATMPAGKYDTSAAAATIKLKSLGLEFLTKIRSEALVDSIYAAISDNTAATIINKSRDVNAFIKYMFDANDLIIIKDIRTDSVKASNAEASTRRTNKLLDFLINKQISYTAIKAELENDRSDTAAGMRNELQANIDVIAGKLAILKDKQSIAATLEALTHSVTQDNNNLISADHYMRAMRTVLHKDTKDLTSEEKLMFKDNLMMANQLILSYSATTDLLNDIDINQISDDILRAKVNTLLADARVVTNKITELNPALDDYGDKFKQLILDNVEDPRGRVMANAVFNNLNDITHIMLWFDSMMDSDNPFAAQVKKEYSIADDMGRMAEKRYSADFNKSMKQLLGTAYGNKEASTAIFDNLLDDKSRLLDKFDRIVDDRQNELLNTMNVAKYNNGEESVEYGTALNDYYEFIDKHYSSPFTAEYKAIFDELRKSPEALAFSEYRREITSSIKNRVLADNDDYRIGYLSGEEKQALGALVAKHRHLQQTNPIYKTYVDAAKDMFDSGGTQQSFNNELDEHNMRNDKPEADLWFDDSARLSDSFKENIDVHSMLYGKDIRSDKKLIALANANDEAGIYEYLANMSADKKARRAKRTTDIVDTTANGLIRKAIEESTRPYIRYDGTVDYQRMEKENKPLLEALQLLYQVNIANKHEVSALRKSNAGAIKKRHEATKIAKARAKKKAAEGGLIEQFNQSYDDTVDVADRGGNIEENTVFKNVLNSVTDKYSVIEMAAALRGNVAVLAKIAANTTHRRGYNKTGSADMSLAEIILSSTPKKFYSNMEKKLNHLQVGSSTRQLLDINSEHGANTKKKFYYTGIAGEKIALPGLMKLRPSEMSYNTEDDSGTIAPNQYYTLPGTLKEKYKQDVEYDEHGNVAKLDVAANYNSKWAALDDNEKAILDLLNTTVNERTEFVNRTITDKGYAVALPSTLRDTKQSDKIESYKRTMYDATGERKLKLTMSAISKLGAISNIRTPLQLDTETLAEYNSRLNVILNDTIGTAIVNVKGEANLAAINDFYTEAYDIENIMDGYTYNGTAKAPTHGIINHINSKLTAVNDKTHTDMLDTNLAESMKTFIKSSFKYQYRAAMESTVRLGLLYTKQASYTADFAGESLIDIAKSKISGKTTTATISGADSRTYTRFQKDLSMTFYDQFTVPTKYDKLTDAFRMYTSIKGIGFNLSSAGKNIAFGTMSMVIEAASGYHFNMSELRNGMGMYNGAGISMAVDRKSGIATTVNSGWEQLMEVIEEGTENPYMMDKKEQKKYSKLTDKGKKLFLKSAFLLQTEGERAMQNASMFAMLKNHRISDGKVVSLVEYIRHRQSIDGITEVVDADIRDNKQQALSDIDVINTNKSEYSEDFNKLTSLYDSYELKDGVIRKKDNIELGEEELSKFRLKVQGVNHKIHGIYNKADKGTIENYKIGEAIMQFKHWLRPAIVRRYGSRTFSFNGERSWNVRRNEFDEGDHKTVARLLLNPFSKDSMTYQQRNGAGKVMAVVNGYLEYFNNSKAYWSVLDDSERAAVKRTAMEAILIGGSGLLAMLVLGMGDDDDDDIASMLTPDVIEDAMDTDAGALLKKILDGASLEMLSFVPLYGWYATAKAINQNTVPAVDSAMSVLKAVLRGLQYGFVDDDTRMIDSGSYKGRSFFSRDLINAVPPLNQFQKLAYMNENSGITYKSMFF